MARTPTPPPKRKAPAKAAGRPSITAVLLRLPSDLVADMDAIATTESRTRAKQMEVALREFARAYRQRTTAPQ